MPDTSILLTATDEGRAEHEQALGIVNGWPAQGTTLYTSGQVIRQYLGAATRPATRNGLGLTAPDALENARAFRSRMLFLTEEAGILIGGVRRLPRQPRKFLENQRPIPTPHNLEPPAPTSDH